MVKVYILYSRSLKGGSKNSKINGSSACGVADQVCKTLLDATGIHDYLLNNIQLFPNPTTGTVVLKAENIKGRVSLKLYDTLNRQAFTQTLDGSLLQQGIPIDLNDLAGSVFFLNISADAGFKVLKVIKY